MSVKCLSLLTNTVGLKGKGATIYGKIAPFCYRPALSFFLLTLVKVLIIRTFCDYASNAQLTLYIALFCIRRITHIIYLLFNNYRRINTTICDIIRQNTSTPFMI